MASFQFPDPAVQQTVTNTDTGATYQWQADPGKWVLTVPNYDTSYVEVTGDTMTGPLWIHTDDVNPAGNLYLKSTSYQTKNLNHLIYCESTNGKPMFGVTNDGYTTTHHNLQCTSSTAFFTSGGSPNSTAGYCAFSILGPAVGDTHNLPYPSRLSPILRTWYNFDGTGTEVRYFGMIDDANAIVNKSYVDTLTTASAITEGGIINAAGGSVDTSGNLTIKQSDTDSQDGRIYLKGSDNTSNISLYGAGGGIDMKGSLSFNSTNNTKNIRAYGSSSPVIKFLTGTEASTVAERLSISSSTAMYQTSITLDGDDQGIYSTGKANNSVSLYSGSTQSAAFGATYCSLRQPVTANLGLTVLANGISVNAGTSTFKGKTEFQNSLLFSQSGSQVADIKNKLLFYGLKADGSRPSWEAITVGIDPNNENFSAMTIGKRMYWSGTYAYFTGSVRNYLDNQIWDFRTNDTDNAILTKLDGAGKTFDIGCNTTITAPTVSPSQAGLVIETTNNTTTLWNATQPGHLRFQTTSGNNGGTCGIQVQGESSSPAFTMTIGAPGYSLNQVFTYSYSATYGKRVYIYPDWGQGYNNAPNLPDATPVTLGYLRANGLVTIASTTATQEATDPSGPEHGIISAQTTVTVPSQMTLNADLDGGQGFTLKGKTVADPTSHDGDVLKTTHAASNTSAELEYYGSTAGDNSVQTKESVAAAITAAVPATATWDFFNSSSTGTNSTLDGYWTVQYSYTATQGQVIIKAKNDTNTIANGTVVCDMPAASCPKTVAVIRLASRDGLTTADAVFSALDQKITIQNVQGVGDTRLEGMLIYPIHAD